FSSDRLPMLWRAIPAIEELETAWETKCDAACFALYKEAVQRGLQKIGKYYNRFNEKPVYILALVLHPYYKLDYIKMAWGGSEGQERECLSGI
ncbi:hypothetical protein PAXRUDRAFT_163534, partial [Paxillus rubicundulus Ve08.2h10]